MFEINKNIKRGWLIRVYNCHRLREPVLKCTIQFIAETHVSAETRSCGRLPFHESQNMPTNQLWISARATSSSKTQK